MHNELRYQVKTHAISEKLSKGRNKVSHLLPILFFLNKKNAIWKRHHMQGKIKPDDANTEKQSLDLLFLSSPTSTCNVLSRE
jgi:hypothetical protein